MSKSPAAQEDRLGFAFILAIAGLALLPLWPELWLWLRHYDDLKAFASIAYYECIASFLFCAPAFLLPQRWARGWIGLVAALMGIATLMTGFQAVTVGARWDSTAHAAVMETNPYETWGFINAFVSWKTAACLAAAALAFTACALVAIRSPRPRARVRLIVVAIAALGSAYGIRNAIQYGGNPIHRVQVSDDCTLNVIDAGINSYHPVLRLAFTHWNFAVSHEYRLRVLRETSAHLSQLQGATAIAGATPPRVVLIVVGESASRRHWSLYGYSRDTNPRLARLGNDLFVFRDVICRTVGTLTEIQGMFCTPKESLPVFALFSAAGYKTHWLSAQLDQGPNDVKVAAIVQSCAERKFLNGAYDENLVGLVRRAAAEPGKQFIVANLFGSHVRYDDRYPQQFAVFSGTGEKGHRLAAYDNSIRYTDHVLAEMIEVLKARPEPSCFLYLSDHAEDVYDSNPDEYLFRNDSIATNAMYEIPMVAWVSPEYRSANRDFVSRLAAAQSKPFQSLGLYHSVIDLARLQHPIYDPHTSLFSPEFDAHDRHIGAVGRVYRRETSTPAGSVNSAAHD